MDRIRRALDLAREERNGVGHPREAEYAHFEPRSDVRMITPIRYTKTKVVSPSAGWLESNRIIDPVSATTATAAYRLLRTQVIQRMDAKGWRSIAVFSPSESDGKTTTALNLAIALANQQGQTVLLVDFDFKQPMIGKMLGIDPKQGVDDVLRGEARIEECLYHPEPYDRLVVLPARAPMNHSSEALASARCKALVSELYGRYPERLLVFDLPPVLTADDALAFAPYVECGLVVAAEGRTRRDDLSRCVELLHKTPLVGTVLNRATDGASVAG